MLLQALCQNNAQLSKGFSEVSNLLSELKTANRNTHGSGYGNTSIQPGNIESLSNKLDRIQTDIDDVKATNRSNQALSTWLGTTSPLITSVKHVRDALAELLDKQGDDSTSIMALLDEVKAIKATLLSVTGKNTLRDAMQQIEVHNTNTTQSYLPYYQQYYDD